MACPGVYRCEWTHIFPDNVERTVTLHVREGVEDVDEAVIRISLRNGTEVTGDFRRDLIASLYDNVSFFDNGRAALVPLADYLRGTV